VNWPKTHITPPTITHQPPLLGTGIHLDEASPQLLHARERWLCGSMRFAKGFQLRLVHFSVDGCPFQRCRGGAEKGRHEGEAAVFRPTVFAAAAAAAAAAGEYICAFNDLGREAEDVVEDHESAGGGGGSGNIRLRAIDINEVTAGFVGWADDGRGGASGRGGFVVYCHF